MNNITIRKPYRRWLFGGIGFHNSEATMLPMMTEEFKNEKVLKVFREISPTFTRVYAAFYDWTKEAMDHFADYYDLTFRAAGTLVYAVPGRMPFPGKDFDIKDHCEKVASNLEYLVKVRKCAKIRYFCVTNELSCGNTYAYLSSRLDLLKALHEELYTAFERHGLDIGLLATDCSGVDKFPQIKWACDNMDEVTSDYCAHLYLNEFEPGEKGLYPFCLEKFGELTEEARKKQKRFILGEYGINTKDKFISGPPMMNDMSYGAEKPENGGIYAVAVAEVALSVINSGTFAAAFWSMTDYPDPFIREDGDTPEEKARYEVARFSGHGIQFRYNKNGLIKWCDEEKDYSPRPALYTMGYMAKLFKKGSRVLVPETDNDNFRAGAVTNADGSVSVCVINLSDKEEKTLLTLEHKCDKPMRRYEFLADNPPENEFGDLQNYTETVEMNGKAELTFPKRSVTFLTTDYVERTPAQIGNVRLEEGKLVWDASEEAEHRYYRVFRNGKQIASTVAEYVKAEGKAEEYRVISVDKYGNAGN